MPVFSIILKGQKQLQNSFIKILKAMQREPVPNGYSHEHHENQEEEQTANYDFTECTRIKKLTTHDIYKFKHHNLPLVVKLFAPEALPNYQQELNLLSRMNQPQILRIMHSRTAINPVSCQPLERSHLIVLREAVRGDLNDYLPRFGRMTEKMARTYFRQLVEGLSSAAKLKPAIYHPSLQASSILLDQRGQLYICGWSQLINKDEKAKLQESLFSCGEILICMLTSFMPFYKKYSTTDAFFKFISSEHIHKFWQELQKRMARVDKKFIFSAELKKMIENIFLKKIHTFQEIQDHSWFKGEIHTSEQLLALLEENQKVKLEKMAVRRKQELASEQNRKKVLMEFQLSYGLQRSSPEEQQFINDYQENMMKQEDLPQGTCNLKVEGSPAFVVACLRCFLRQENGKPSVLVREQFVLSNHKVVKISNYIIIDLTFAVSLLEEDEDQGLNEPDPADSVALKLKISFYRNEKQIYAEIEVLESNFNSYYTILSIRYLEDRINRKREMTSFEKKEAF